VPVDLAPSVLTIVVAALLIVIGGCVMVIRGFVLPDVGKLVPIAIIGVCLVLIGGMFWWRAGDGEQQMVDARAIELTMQAAAPGSAFACLDVVANADVEQACEAVLFATPEAVARAIAYVDARVSVLAAGASLAARDPHVRSSFDRIRRALEPDRYGFVAHVLRTRGCEQETCAELKLLGNAEHVEANMKALTFESHVNVAARAWPSNATAAALIGHSVGAPSIPNIPAPTMSPSAVVGAAYDVPMTTRADLSAAASLPVPIATNPELPTAEGQRVNRPAPPKRVQNKATRRSRGGEAPSQEPLPAQQPTSVLPPPPPASQAVAAPQPDGGRQ
jgi:hypothetical protein